MTWKLTTYTGILRLYKKQSLDLLLLCSYDKDLLPEIIIKAEVLKLHLEELPVVSIWEEEKNRARGKGIGLVSTARKAIRHLAIGLVERPFFFLLYPMLLMAVLFALMSIGIASLFLQNFMSKESGFLVNVQNAFGQSFSRSPHTFIFWLFLGQSLLLMLSTGLIILQNKWKADRDFLIQTRLFMMLRTEHDKACTKCLRSTKIPKKTTLMADVRSDIVAGWCGRTLQAARFALPLIGIVGLALAIRAYADGAGELIRPYLRTFYAKELDPLIDLPWWKLLLPLEPLSGRWATTGFLLVHGLETFLGEPSTFYLLTAIMVSVGYVLTYLTFGSLSLAFLLGLALATTTFNYHVYSVPGGVIMLPLVSFLLLFAYSQIEWLRSSALTFVWPSATVVSCLLFALSYEGWLDVVPFIVIVYPVLAWVSNVTVIQCAVGDVYLSFA